MDLPKDQDPYEIGLQLMENGAKLSEAALAFEAAIQRDENHVDAWLKLGEVQTQNEKDCWYFCLGKMFGVAREFRGVDELGN